MTIVQSQPSDASTEALKILLLFDSTFPYTGGGRETGIYHICKYGHHLLDMRMIVLAPPVGVKDKQFSEAERYCRIEPVFSLQSLAHFRGYNRFAQLADNLLFPRRARAQARKICHQWRPDIVLCVHAGPVGAAAIRLARQFGCKSVLNMRSHYSRELQETRSSLRLLLPYIRRVENRVIRDIDLVLANGEDTHEICLRQGRTKPTVLMHNGVDTELFQPRDGSAMRAELGLNDCMVFLSNNPLRTIKGPQDAISALALMPEEIRHRCRLVFLGKGRFGQYAEQAARLGVGALVKHLGYIPHEQLAQYLILADVAIHPVLFSAGTTHASLETLACGLPQVSYDAASLRSTCINGETGLLVPCGDVGALATAMTRMAGDEALRRRMALAARRKSLEFDWHRYVEKFAAALGDLFRPI